MKTRRKERIEQLKQEIRTLVGFDPVFGTSGGCPPESEEALLERLWWNEKLARDPLCERLASANIVLTDPTQLRDEELTGKLWDAIHALVTMSIAPANTDHLSDREVYTRLWEICSRRE